MGSQLDACVQTCAATTGCAGVLFNNGNGVCNMQKATALAAKFNSFVDSYVACTSSPPPPPVDPTLIPTATTARFSLLPSTDSFESSSSLQHLSFVTSQQCERACKADPRCVGFLLMGTSECHLKDRMAEGGPKASLGHSFVLSLEKPIAEVAEERVSEASMSLLPRADEGVSVQPEAGAKVAHPLFHVSEEDEKAPEIRVMSGRAGHQRKTERINPVFRAAVAEMTSGQMGTMPADSSQVEEACGIAYRGYRRALGMNLWTYMGEEAALGAFLQPLTVGQCRVLCDDDNSCMGFLLREASHGAWASGCYLVHAAPRRAEAIQTPALTSFSKC
eukprot:TRINITY_DN7445_c0_g1_i1.p1 TRINITY_DN7445_c0_g1~~TRINITY_DN7445_c0_g1_i1.p1  ORF type:complete len:386 (+),score=72.56 TRINITY_DN7445_c0_g1_i1:162-1160(+)